MDSSAIVKSFRIGLSHFARDMQTAGEWTCSCDDCALVQFARGMTRMDMAEKAAAEARAKLEATLPGADEKTRRRLLKEYHEFQETLLAWVSESIPDDIREGVLKELDQEEIERN